VKAGCTVDIDVAAGGHDNPPGHRIDPIPARAAVERTTLTRLMGHRTRLPASAGRDAPTQLNPAAKPPTTLSTHRRLEPTAARLATARRPPPRTIETRRFQPDLARTANDRAPRGWAAQPKVVGPARKRFSRAEPYYPSDGVTTAT
jgi:hypothetical protein